MSETRLVTTLRYKRAQILSSIATYERKLAQARAELAELAACIAHFDASGEGEDLSSYLEDSRLFEPGEMLKLCVEALITGPRTSKWLAVYVMAAKSLDTGDDALVRAMMSRIALALRRQSRRGLIRDFGKVKGSTLWSLKGPDPS